MDLHGHPGPGSDASIPQLLDAVGKKLDSLAETLRYGMVLSKRLQQWTYDEFPFCSQTDVATFEEVWKALQLSKSTGR